MAHRRAGRSDDAQTAQPRSTRMLRFRRGRRGAVRRGWKTIEQVDAEHLKRFPKPFTQGRMSADIIRQDRDSEMSTGTRKLYVAEPPPTYQVRPAIVVDCSAVSGILFDEPWRGEAISRIAARTLYAPHLLDHEVVSVALKKHRRTGRANRSTGRWKITGNSRSNCARPTPPGNSNLRCATSCRPTMPPTSGWRPNSRRRWPLSTRSSPRPRAPTSPACRDHNQPCNDHDTQDAQGMDVEEALRKVLTLLAKGGGPR